MPELFDVVELIADLPDQDLYSGMQGTIVEIHPERSAYEVEFSNDNGEMINLLALPRERFVVVWRSHEEEWVPPAEQVTELVSRLSDEKAAEVLDFVRFLHARRLRSHREEAPQART